MAIVGLALEVYLAWAHRKTFSTQARRMRGCYPRRPTLMSERPPLAEYLVISRGQWDRTLARDEIQHAIDQFYTWLDRGVKEGTMKRGQRLTAEGKTIARKDVITDGPFGEAKEVIGGYWFILGNNLDEAAQIAKGNSCLDCGLSFEVRPIDRQRATPDNTRQS
jgi:hypothetical protein